MLYLHKKSLKEFIKRLKNFTVPFQYAVSGAGKLLLTDWCRKHTLWSHVQRTYGGKTTQVDSFNKSKVLNKPELGTTYVMGSLYDQVLWTPFYANIY